MNVPDPLSAMAATPPAVAIAPNPAPEVQATDGFAQHGITHLSPSSINLWINAPDVWIAQKLHGHPSKFGAAAARGVATEQGVVKVLYDGMLVEDAGAEVVAEFDAKFPIKDAKITKERDAIRPMMDQAIAALEGYGRPSFPEDKDGRETAQNKIELLCRCDGWTIPVVGYLDLQWPEQGLIVDLKTTHRVPSVMTPDHQVQRCVYDLASGNSTVKFLYTSAKKWALLEDGDTSLVMARVKAHIIRLEAFLRNRDVNELTSIVPVNESTFYWNGAEDVRQEVYGL